MLINRKQTVSTDRHPNRSPTEVQRQHSRAGADSYSELITRVFNCTGRHATCRCDSTAKESRSRCRQPRKLPANITRRDLRPIVVHVDTEAFRPKPYVRDIGIVLDDTMDMDRHVSHTCRLAYHHLRSIANVRNSLTTTACETIVLSLVISRLDFGNATLYAISETLLHRLQVVQNSAACLIMRVRRREHITPILFALHWLPVRQRIQFKILTLVYRCQNHQAPTNLSACITPYVPGRSLRSADHGLLTEHRYRLERYDRRCFSVVGPALWNELPTPVKECQSFPSSKAKLKTHLFRQAFRDLV